MWVKPPNHQAKGAKDLKVAVNTHARLVEFCEKTLNKPLTHFIDDWTHLIWLLFDWFSMEIYYSVQLDWLLHVFLKVITLCHYCFYFVLYPL